MILNDFWDMRLNPVFWIPLFQTKTKFFNVNPNHQVVSQIPNSYNNFILYFQKEFYFYNFLLIIFTFGILMFQILNKNIFYNCIPISMALLPFFPPFLGYYFTDATLYYLEIFPFAEDLLLTLTLEALFNIYYFPDSWEFS